MRPRTSLSALATLIVAMVFNLVMSGPAHAAGPAYVALGDSYSAGHGPGNYDSSSGNCHRSLSAYPYLWKNAHAPSSFANTLHSLVVSPSWESYHPTATGHTSGYYPVPNANG